MGQGSAENTTVLVTGGSGLIGRAVTDNLLGRGARVVVFDAAPSAHDGQAGVTHVQASVLDVEALDEVFARERVGAVIHLASLLSPPTSAAPRNGLLVNSMGTLNVFEAARDHEVRRVVWASSSSVFGRRDGYEAITGKTLVGDGDLLSPQDLYGGTKAFNEVLGLHYRGRGLDVVGLRPVLTYGPGPQSGPRPAALAARHAHQPDLRARLRRPLRRDLPASGAVRPTRLQHGHGRVRHRRRDHRHRGRRGPRRHCDVRGG
jgi:nucleoside-diphosphate-sugar epimerase